MTNNKFMLPWKMTKGGAFDYGIDNCQGGLVMGDTHYYPVAPDEEQMAFIVRACNSHDQLVAALKVADRFCGSLTSEECPDTVHNMIRLALASAEGEGA